jgi:DMSO/TMAO reductase YedYZ molybdopterin-dependent catalytic subunit
MVVHRKDPLASVKWLSAIELTDHPFAGYFQTTKYRYEVEGTAEPVRRPWVKTLTTPDNATSSAKKERVREGGPGQQPESGHS